MISVITEFGSSFKGLATYLYHDDEQANSSDRVAWTHTHNLATDDPERAWRVMAATAMNQAELKANANIKNTGRKSHSHVMHYVISWHPEERDELTKEEMIAAAQASMRYMGTYEGEKVGKKNIAKRTQFGDEHQAVFVCHDEGGSQAPPHVHIMLNRVHPEHGVMLPDSKDYEKLSYWALEYRQAQGKEHYCPERVKNAAKKAQGIMTSNPRKPRNVYENEQEALAADPGSRKAALLEQQRRRGKELTAKTHKMKRQQATAFKRLEDHHQQRERSERKTTREKIRVAKSHIKSDYAVKIENLIERQQDEWAAFHKAKSTVSGHIRNTWTTFKTREWMHDIRTKKLHAVTDSFKMAFSSGFQQQQLEAFHKREQRQLRGQRLKEERQVSRKLHGREQGRLETLRTDYTKQRNDLLLTQNMDQAKLKAEWKKHIKNHLAIMSEDDRPPKKESRQAPHRTHDDLPGRQKKTQSPLGDSKILSDQAPSMVPINKTLYDIPPDDLRNATRRLKEMEKEQEKDNEKGPERET